MINTLKISVVALALGAAFVSCAEEETCFKCTASDPNGVGTSVSDEMCKVSLSDTDRAEFEASFRTLHNPAMYNISCADK